MISKTLKTYPMLSRLVLLLLVVAAVIVAIARQYSKTEGNTSLTLSGVPGLQQPVDIRYDERGIPSIQAQSQNDAYFATGFVHASDRLTQLELQRRRVSGQLSAVLGRGHLQSDIWMRTLGLHKKAEEALQHLSKPALDALNAYAAGINHYLSQDVSPSISFDVLGVKPAKWTAADSLAIQKLFALNLGMNFNKELENVLAASVFDSNSDMTAIANLLQSKYDFEQTNRIGGKGVGSNAWVIAGEHTKSGKPILANDPHLSLSIPSIWYAIAQKGGQLDVSGMSFVGLPLVIFGANQHISWGGTNLLADVQDLVIERQHPENANLYFHQGQWLPYQVRKERIEIKADAPASLQKPIKPVTVVVRSTVNGPVISDVQSPLDAPLSLRWTALAEKDTSFEALMKVNLAKDWAGFSTALKLYQAPTLNFLYSDINNNIGYIGAGDIPLRNGFDGQTPIPGWSENSQWQGMIPFDDLPRQFNPKSGYIVNANDKVSAKNGAFISSDWADPARAIRIKQLLDGYISSNKKISVTDVQNMQMDSKDLNGADFVTLLSGLSSANPELQNVLTHINQWNGEMAADSIAPVMYVLWLKNIKTQLLDDELFNAWRGQKPLRSSFLSSYINALSYRQIKDWIIADAGVCDKRQTDKIENCEQITLAALQDSLKQLKKISGDDPDGWRWNQVSKVVVPHMIFAQASVLEDLYNREYQSVGTYDTVNVSGYQFDEYEGFSKSFGATFRQVIAINDDIQVYLMNSTGQSESLLSEHYDDMVEAFGDGRLLQLNPQSKINTKQKAESNNEVF